MDMVNFININKLIIEVHELLTIRLKDYPNGNIKQYY